MSSLADKKKKEEKKKKRKRKEKDRKKKKVSYFFDEVQQLSILRIIQHKVCSKILWEKRQFQIPGPAPEFNKKIKRK